LLEFGCIHKDGLLPGSSDCKDVRALAHPSYRRHDLMVILSVVQLLDLPWDAVP
jgi:hypothetical protein